MTTPTSARGAGLYALKPWFTRRLGRIVELAVARRLSPDLFTAAGVLAAGAAGASVAFGLWPLAALFMVLRLAGANLDGAVARARGVSRPWGFVVNEIGDRTSDLLAFGGLAVWAAQRSGGPGLDWLSWPVLQVLIAALAATLPTFASLAAVGAGVPRRNGGPLGKTERCLFIVLATAIPVIMPILLTQLVNGSLLTTALRLRAAHRDIKARRAEEASAGTERIRMPRRVVLAERFAAAAAAPTVAFNSAAPTVAFSSAAPTVAFSSAAPTTAFSSAAPTVAFNAATQRMNAPTRPLKAVARHLTGVAA